MIRRAASILFFFFGGWALMTEALALFLDLEPGLDDVFVVIAMFGTLAVLLLLIGAWISPGERWRELGLTILIGAGLGGFGGLMVLLVFTDPQMKEMLPPGPEIELAPLVGVLNMLFLGGLGLLLYRRRTG